MKERLFALLKLLIGLALLALLAYRVDLGTVWGLLRASHLGLLLVAMGLYLAAIASNALKWGVLLRAQGVRVPFGSLLRHTFVGVFFNNFMPFVGADVIRGYGLVQETSSAADVAVSVLVDRLVGLLAFASAGTFAALLAVRLGIDEPALWIVAQLGLALTFGLIVGFLLLLSGRLRRLVEHGVGRLPLLRPLLPLVGRLSGAVGAYRARPGALLLAYLVGLSTILLSNGVNWLLFSALGQPIPWLYVFIFNPIIGMSMALPLSISGLGVNQHIFPSLYGLVGVAPGPAVAASLLLQLTIIITSIPGGLLWLLHRSSTPPPLPVPLPSSAPLRDRS